MIGQGEGFFLVVRDINGGDTGLMENVTQEVSELFTQGAIESAERFIEHEQARARGKGACQGNTLLFAAREIGDATVCKVCEVDLGERFGCALGNFGFWQALHSQAKGDVFRNVAVGKKGIFLKHEAKATLVNGESGQVFAIPAHAALVGLFEASNDTQQGAFAAS